MDNNAGKPTPVRVGGSEIEVGLVRDPDGRPEQITLTEEQEQALVKKLRTAARATVTGVATQKEKIWARPRKPRGRKRRG